MADSVDFGSEKPDAAGAHEHEQQLEQTDGSSLNEKDASPPLSPASKAGARSRSRATSRRTRSRASSNATDDSDPLEPLEIALSGGGGVLPHAEVARIRKAAGLPVVVGFGISTPEAAEAVARVADGCVIGSAIVKQVAEGKPVAQVLDFVRGLAEGVHRA